MKNTNQQQQLFNDILENHKGLFQSVLRTYCRDEADRQDLLQEILVQVWGALHKYDDKYKLTTWLYRIALNVAISHHRKNVRQRQHLVAWHENIESAEDEPSGDKEKQLRILEQFISELKEIDKALMLLYLEKKSHAEIGEILGLSVSNVGTRIARIKDKLKQHFNK